MIKINLDNDLLSIFDNEQKLEINNKINFLIEKCINIEGLNDKNIYVSIQSVSKSQIKNLNKEYRKIDKETDVLSFPVFEKDEIKQIKDKEIKINEIELGDILICLDIIKIHAEEYNTGIKRELIYMIIHGILHLLGYDHIYEEEKIIMRTKEKELLSLGGF